MDFKPLIMPRRLYRVDDAKVGEAKLAQDRFGRFVAEPFERGFGVTIGNSLRRILLSSIQGAAPVALRIDDVRHEFSGKDGVKEDVSDIMLNLKMLEIKMDSGARGGTLAVARARMLPTRSTTMARLM